MPEISKYDLEIQELKGEIKLLSERVSTIKDNHLKHIEDKINAITKVMYTIGFMVLGQLLWVITRALM
jgi:Mg2+ and Co2+ transporter CorA|tara:strand:- start:1090 stop:1293 length:204 start_codon:yes stop_codon:yes gene_type:complete